MNKEKLSMILLGSVVILLAILVVVKADSELTYIQAGDNQLQILPLGGDSEFGGVLLGSETLNITSQTSYNRSNIIYIFSGSTNVGASCTLYGNWSTSTEYSYSTCYQETANVSTSCGGLSTGGYQDNSANTGGGWMTDGFITGPIGIYDGVWSTRSWSFSSASNSSLYINYTKPVGTTLGTLWNIDTVGSGQSTSTNITIPNSCLSQSNLKLYILVNRNDGVFEQQALFSCYNGSEYILLANKSDYNVYEEAIYWNISSTTTSSWVKNETKSVNANTAFNFTQISFNGINNYMWGMNCSDSSDHMWGSNYTFTSSVAQILLNGQAANRIYEQGTYANITANFGCLSIDQPDYGDNYTCSEGNMFVNFSTIPFYEYKFPQNGLENISIAKNTQLLISTDTRNYVKSLNMSIWGNHSINVNINYQGISTIAYLIGDLFGNVLKVMNFDGDTATSETLIFTTISNFIETVYVPFPVTGTIQNCTLDITGTAADSNNAFSYTETFNNTRYINTTKTDLGSPVGYYDNFKWNKTGRWLLSGEQYNSGTFESVMKDGYIYLRTTAPAYSPPPGAVATAKSTDFDMYNKTNVMMYLNFTYVEDLHGSGASCENHKYVYVTDGTTNLIMYNSDQDTAVFNLSFIKLSNNQWEVFKNNISQGVKDTSVLNPSKNWELYFSESSSGRYGSTRDNCAVTNSFIAVESIRASGIYPYTKENDYAYNMTGSMMSTIINVSRDNIISARLSASSSSDSGITYELSNDNQTTWETTINRQFHTFTSTGKQLSYRINYTLPTNTTYKYISKVIVDIVPSETVGLDIDVGSDGIYEYSNNGTINTTLQVYLNESSFKDYIDFCPDSTGTALQSPGLSYNNTVCSVPIDFISLHPGIVTIDNLNCPTILETMVLDETSINTLLDAFRAYSIIDGNILINVNYTGNDSVTFGNYRMGLWGTKNVTASLYDYSSGSVISRIIQILYSEFNVDIIPSNIDYWDVGPNIYTWVQNNIPPYGNANGNGNPFWNISKGRWDHNMSVYLKYNDTVNSCATTSITGYNSTFVIGSTSQELAHLINSTGTSVSTYTNISCGAVNSTLIFPYFCFSSMAEGAVMDAESNWDGLPCGVVE